MWYFIISATQKWVQCFGTGDSRIRLASYNNVSRIHENYNVIRQSEPKRWWDQLIYINKVVSIIIFLHLLQIYFLGKQQETIQFYCTIVSVGCSMYRSEHNYYPRPRNTTHFFTQYSDRLRRRSQVSGYGELFLLEFAPAGFP